MHLDDSRFILLNLGAEVMELGSERLLRGARALFRRRRWGSYSTVRPGPATPYWNALATELEAELRAYGAKSRLARLLGVPRQRIHDFLRGRSRQPDAELTLRLLHWLAAKRRGRDLSL
jgi:hypothetical protein